ncbi:MAG: hypothetical protein EZS28_048705, partial [Streblomastix strix]
EEQYLSSGLAFVLEVQLPKPFLFIYV